MLIRGSTRLATTFVKLPFNQVTVALVGVSPKTSANEVVDTLKHFRKYNINVESVGLGIFDKSFDDMTRVIDTTKPLKELPPGEGQQLMRLFYECQVSGVPIRPVARHYSHAVVRSSWMGWEHPREMLRMLYEFGTFSLAAKYFTRDAYRFFDKVAPHFAYQIYAEPAKFAVLKLLKDQTLRPGSALILTLPIHLIDPAVQFLSEELSLHKLPKITDEDINILMARGASFWNLLFLIWGLIPIFSLTICARWLTEVVTSYYHEAGGGIDRSHSEKVKGVIGTKWVRDLRRD
jgi:hypothetical protein